MDFFVFFFFAEVILSDEVEFDGIVLTKEELAQFDGSDPEKPIYLGLNHLENKKSKQKKQTKKSN